MCLDAICFASLVSDSFRHETERTDGCSGARFRQSIGQINAEPWQFERLITLTAKTTQRMMEPVVCDSIGADQQFEAKHPMGEPL